MGTSVFLSPFKQEFFVKQLDFDMLVFDMLVFDFIIYFKETWDISIHLKYNKKQNNTK